jgi:hypothetical protein
MRKVKNFHDLKFQNAQNRAQEKIILKSSAQLQVVLHGLQFVKFLRAVLRILK